MNPGMPANRRRYGRRAAASERHKSTLDIDAGIWQRAGSCENNDHALAPTFHPDMPSRIIQITDTRWITVEGGLEISCLGPGMLRFYRGGREIGSVAFAGEDAEALARSEAARLAKWIATGNGEQIFKFSMSPVPARTSPVAMSADDPMREAIIRRHYQMGDVPLPPEIAQQRHGREF